MECKDCGQFNGRSRLVLAMAAAAASACGAQAGAGEVRLWPAAVVVQDEVRVSDVCLLRGFDRDEEAALARHVLCAAPPQGGRRVIHARMVREALSAAGVNAALTTLHGATECEVARPMAPAPKSDERAADAGGANPRLAPHARRNQPAQTARSSGEAAPSPNEEPDPRTLRQVVIDWLGRELTRNGGRVEVEFTHDAAPALDLTTPPHEFRLRRQRGGDAGVMALEVTVLVDGQVRQTLDIVCNAALFVPVVVARRAINQAATVKDADVEVTEVRVATPDRTIVSEPALVIGRRAKRFIPAGEAVRPRDLEEVPVVTRNQLVRLVATVGGVRVETAGRALASGTMGQTVNVRPVDDRGREFEGVITAPGVVSVGLDRRSALALGTAP